MIEAEVWAVYPWYRVDAGLHLEGSFVRQGFALKAAIGGVVATMLGGSIWLGSRGSDVHYTTFEVRRGPLDVKVLEGGNVEALESQEIKSQVKGWQGVKILYIIEEGYSVTEEDVKNKKKLVELDGSELEEKLTTSEISFRGTQASLTEAEKGYDIQRNQSESDIYAAELEMKFALLEMEKYLGSEVAARMHEAIDKLEVDRAANAALEPPTEDEAANDKLPEVDLEELRLEHPDIDFRSYARKEVLGSGEASQQLRKMEDDLMLAEGEHAQALTEFAGKKRLYDHSFITENELASARIKKDKQEVSVQTAETAQSLFIEYEFPKQAEKLVSDYIQAKRKLVRTEQEALSKIAQAKAKLLSAQARYKIEGERIEEYRDQIEKCIMVAERVGLVVYGGSGRQYWDNEPIKEGATIREKQAIITIPDMATMAAKVNIHESDIKKIEVGLKTIVRVDAYPEEKMEGEVIKVGVLPVSENRWMNPDLKVYETTVQIKGVYEWLKPGMSAEVEIMIARLEDVLYIPIQSVVPQGNKQVCFVIENGVPVAREIETGEITLEFITVTKGLEEGESVLIRPPEGSRKEEAEDTEDTEEEEAQPVDEVEPEDEPKPAELNQLTRGGADTKA